MPEAIKWLRMAAEQGNVEALCKLGFVYAEGDGVEKNMPEAVKWLRKAVSGRERIPREDEAAIYYYIGNAYSDGDGVEKNVEEAVKWWRKAADSKSALAYFRLGNCYITGDGIGWNPLMAVVRWLQALFFINVIVSVIVILVVVDCVFRGPLCEMLQKWLRFAKCRRSAIAGDTEAIFKLACRYVNGDGVKTNLQEAVMWYRKAAEQGHAKAQYELGMAYSNGKGVEKNPPEAAIWYSKAAEQGHAEAQYELGLAYANGEGVEKNPQEALNLYSKAARQGYGPALDALRVMGLKLDSEGRCEGTSANPA